MAMDIYKQASDKFELPEWIHDEVFKVSHRAYCTGFFFGHPKDCQYYENSGYIRNYDVVAVIDECRNGRIYAQQRNKFNRGDILEVLAPGSKPVKITAETIFNEKDEEVESANHAMMKFSVPCSKVFPKNSILRIKK